MKDKIILGIDPGPKESAYVFLCGMTILKAGYVHNSLMLYKVQDSNYDICAVEGISSYGKPVDNGVFKTCELSGVFSQAARSRGKAAGIIYRSMEDEFKSVRAHLCGSNRAKKGEVDKVVKDMFPGCWIDGRKHGPLFLKIDGKYENHKISAAAVALTYQGSKQYQKECNK